MLNNFTNIARLENGRIHFMTPTFDQNNLRVYRKLSVKADQVYAVMPIARSCCELCIHTPNGDQMRVAISKEKTFNKLLAEHRKDDICPHVEFDSLIGIECSENKEITIPMKDIHKLVTLDDYRTQVVYNNHKSLLLKGHPNG